MAKFILSPGVDPLCVCVCACVCVCVLYSEVPLYTKGCVLRLQVDFFAVIQESVLFIKIVAIRHVRSHTPHSHTCTHTHTHTHTQRWPEAEFHVVGDGGHSHSDKGIQTKLLEATDKYKNL